MRLEAITAIDVEKAGIGEEDRLMPRA